MSPFTVPAATTDEISLFAACPSVATVAKTVTLMVATFFNSMFIAPDTSHSPGIVVSWDNCREQAVTLTENRPTTRPGQKVLRRFVTNQGVISPAHAAPS